MENRDRQENRSERIYSYDKIIKSTRLSVEYIKGTHGSYNVKDSKGKYHYVRFNRKTQDWSCDCHWYAHRTCPNKEVWGYCKHILGLLYKFAPTTFEKEVKRLK